jgi:hypothetical protein
MIETSPSLLLIHWQICLVFMNTMDMGVFLFAQNMLGTRDMAIKIYNFKVPSTLDLVSTYNLDVVVLTIIERSQEYWWVAYYHQEDNLVYCHFVCTCMLNLPKCLPTILKEFPPGSYMKDQSAAFKPMV